MMSLMKHVIKKGEISLVPIIPSEKKMWVYWYFVTWSFVLYYSSIYGKTFLRTIKSG